MNKKVNRFGRDLCNLCSSVGVGIANGRVGEDKGIGEFTYIGPNGNSTVDYLLCSACNFDKIMSFAVQSRVESDHLPITFEYNLRCVPDTASCIRTQGDSGGQRRKVRSFIWSDAKKGEFGAKLAVISLNRPPLFLGEQFDQHGDIPTAGAFTERLDDIVNEAAVGMEKRDSKRKMAVNVSGNSWYDGDCKIKKSVTNTLNKWRVRKDETSRIRFRIAKREREKRTYLAGKARRLCGLRGKQGFWKEFRNERKDVPPLPMNEWTEHFRSVLSGDISVPSDTYTAWANYVVGYMGWWKRNNTQETVGHDELIGADEVKKSILRLKLGKAPGVDGFPPEFFKYYPDFWTEFFTLMFNTILKSGVVPGVWQTSLLCPVHKKGDRNSVNNYRGVSLTPV